MASVSEYCNNMLNIFVDPYPRRPYRRLKIAIFIEKSARTAQIAGLTSYVSSKKPPNDQERFLGVFEAKCGVLVSSSSRLSSLPIPRAHVEVLMANSASIAINI